MDRMVLEPRTFKELVEADLRRAARLIIKIQDEIDPVIGDYVVLEYLPGITCNVCGGRLKFMLASEPPEN